MKQIVVVSGKGGSGKTFVSSSLAAIAAGDTNGGTTYADCDVDAADLYLMLDPRQTECTDFVSGRLATVDADRCTGCGRCVSECRFHAVAMTGPPDAERAKVDPIACEGCGVCAYVCPEDAVPLAEQRRGRWCTSSTEYGPLVHAHLEPGEENSGKLVAQVRRLGVSAGSRPGLLPPRLRPARTAVDPQRDHALR